MNQKFVFVFSCVLLALSFSACKKCKDSFSAYIQNDYVPYVQGSTFSMTDNDGRVIHFTASTYTDQYMEDRTADEQKCVDGAQVVHAEFTSDSAGIGFVLDQQGRGSNGAAIDDAFIVGWKEATMQKSFEATVSSSSATAASTTTIVSQGTATIGNRSYNNVVELSNTQQFPVLMADRIWYNKTEGLLKVVFTDSTFWTIVN